MSDYAHEYLPLGDPPSASMLATSSRPATLAIKRFQPTDDDEGPGQPPRNDSQTITTVGISGNASVVNVGGDYITYINDGLASDTYDVLESIEERLKVVHDKKLDNDVHVWLSAPDVSQNLNASLRRRQAGTGAWFLDSPMFAEWKERSNVVLCIYGAPGCGETILCSSIIEAVKHWCTTPLSGWAYFFFDNRNANKGLLLYENFLRSVLSQLCSRCDGVPGAVEAMYQSHGKGRETPSVPALEEALRDLIGAFDNVYIVIDSLDECGDQIELLRWIQTVASWNSAKCHLLATTRPEPDIKYRLELVRNIHTIYLKGSALDRDISNYLNGRLSLINRWTESIRALIRATLLGGADGMFRWVALQMDSLQHCLNAKAVREKLKALPKDLEETYEQLLTVSPHQHDLLRMLHWLAFSARELRLEEIAEVPSVDFDAADGPCYDPDLKYSSPFIALTVCSGLVTETDGTVKLAHFSVKEYLISDRIKTGRAAHFAMSERLSHSVIAQTCVAYLMIFNKPGSIRIPVPKTGPFPLHLYAAEYTCSHLSLIPTTTCPALRTLLLKLFTPQHSDSALVHWVRMYESDAPRPKVDVRLRIPANAVASPLYYASWLGLEYVVGCLLNYGEDINILGGHLGTALHAEVDRGHREILTMLPECGANVNLKGGYHGTALRAAAFKGHTVIAIMLLRRGASVHDQGWRHSTALHAAATQGHTETSQMLLEYGAAVNLQGWRHSTALYAVATRGHTKTGQMLLEHGADVNLPGGDYGTALVAAAVHGHIEFSKMLLEHGANVNLSGGDYGTALVAAAVHGHTEFSKVLLEHGANVNLPGGDYGTALVAAAGHGHIEFSKMLLENGADVNLQGPDYRTALLAAASKDSVEMVKLLLKHGADVNLQGGDLGTALQVTAYEGTIETTKLLLEHGADVNLQGGQFGIALQAAAARGYTKCPTLYLEHSADVRSALQAEAWQGTIETIKLLLEHGADVNMQGGECGTALQMAVYKGSIETAKLLLEHGANINILGGRFGTALQAATYTGHTEILKMLLEYGADANLKAGDFGVELQLAAHEGSTETVKLLLERGACLNLQGGVFGMFGTALSAAARKGHFKTVRVFFELGTHVNLQGLGSLFGTALTTAAREGHIETVEVFLDYRPDFNRKVPGYWTALRAAAGNGHSKLEELLLQHGAAVEARAQPRAQSLPAIQNDQGAS